VEQIEIHFRTVQGPNGWAITRAGSGEPLFTFDLPKQLFDLYAVEGRLSRRGAIDLKAAYLGEFTAVHAPAAQIKVFNFRLDQNWVEGVRQEIRREEPA
jgi:hypothetical protein